MEGQSQIRQALRNHNAQARIVYREPALERIDGKHRRLRRKPEDGLYIRSGPQVSLELTEERLKDVVLKQVRRIRKAFVRKFLSATEAVSGGGAEPSIQTSRINYSEASGTALLVTDELRELLGGRERQAGEADATANRGVKECICFDARTIIKHTLDTEFKPVTFVQ